MEKYMVILNVLIMFILLGFCQCEQGQKRKKEVEIKIAGSTSFSKVLQEATYEYNRLHPKVSFDISGGGSIIGQRQVETGAVDMGISDIKLSRGISETKLAEHFIAMVPIVFAVNKSVSLQSLTKQAAKGILMGEVTKWSELGADDQDIVLINRPEFSGTRKRLENMLLDGLEISAKSKILGSQRSVKEAIQNNPGAIGYLNMDYVDSTVSVLNFEGFYPSGENIATKSYPLLAEVRIFIKKEADKEIKNFIDYLQSKPFRDSILAKYNWFPVKTEEKAVKGNLN